jgi:general stress protein YciG
MIARKKNTQNTRTNEHGKQGFASMPKEKVQEIASKGGQSHGKNHDENENSSNRNSSSSSSSNQTTQNERHGKQGFASMPKEKVQEIASKGGQAHGKNHDSDNNRTR